MSDHDGDGGGGDWSLGGGKGDDAANGGCMVLLVAVMGFVASLLALA